MEGYTLQIERNVVDACLEAAAHIIIYQYLRNMVLCLVRVSASPRVKKV
jgi:hypothetical protein